MADSELMNSKWKRRMALIISGPAVCSIIIQPLSSRSNLSAPTSSAPAHCLMPVGALRSPPATEYFWNIKERLTGNSGNLSRCLGEIWKFWKWRLVSFPVCGETQLDLSMWDLNEVFSIKATLRKVFYAKNTSRYAVSKQCKKIRNTKYSHLRTTTTKAATEAV